MPEVATTVTCPVHGTELHALPTKYGRRWSCSVEGCSVVWWGDTNTTPADYDPREARKAAHNAFDRLWKMGSMSRGEAYLWLQQTFNLDPAQAHIGLFTKEQCEDLRYAVRRWLNRERSEHGNP